MRTNDTERLPVPPKVGFLYDATNGWIEPHLGGLRWLDEVSALYEFVETFDLQAATGLDVLFILGYTKILSQAFLRSNGLNLVVHESALPEGRGFAPVQWQVLAGANEIVSCLIEATDPVDSGDIYGRTFIRLEGHELFAEIRAAQAAATRDLVLTFLRAYPAVTPVPQVGTSTTFRRRARADDELDPDLSLREQFNHLRIVDNDRYPAYFRLHGHVYSLKITKVTE